MKHKVRQADVHFPAMFGHVSLNKHTNINTKPSFSSLQHPNETSKGYLKPNSRAAAGQKLRHQ